MGTNPRDVRKAEQKADKDDLVRYVEELAGPDDAWISLTDAARITRTSEAMARRWVTSGRLPVKKGPVGIPPRTRLVRMSDVAAIRPIVDPTAAITGEVRKLDLASIPRQQLQIIEDHRCLTKLMQDVLEAAKQQEAATHAAFELVTARFQVLAGQVRDQAHQIEQSTDQLAELGRQHQHDREHLRIHLLDQLKEARSAWERALAMQGQEYHDQVDQIRRDFTQQQEALAMLRRDMTTLIEQQVREVLTTLEQLAKDQAHDVATLTERQEQLTQRIEQMATQTEATHIMAASYQKRADTQDQLIQTLTSSLQEEREARKAQASQLAALQGQMQVLRRDLDGRSRRKA